MSIADELAEVLSGVSRPGDFSVSGRVELLAPRIEVEGVGTVAMPLLPAQAKALIKAASQAPYGRGSETIIDTKVRKTWQIGAEQVSIGGKHWEKTLAGIVARVSEGLGISEPVTAELYKLLIYDKSGFFISHRDTEKAPGMFATLVLALPSASTGGELVVRHGGREARLELANDDPSEIAFGAFYADCVHEVRPVTKGYRATLVYNLIRKGKGKPPAPPSYDAETERVAALLGRWPRPAETAEEAAIDTDGELWPLKLVYPLEHAYTPAELAFATLKGADAAVARLLAAAAPKAAVELHLAHLKVWESGSAEYIGRHNWHYRRGQRDAGAAETPAEFEVVEVFDSGRSLSDWRRPDDRPAGLGQLPVEDDEVAPASALEGMTPDEEHFHEATGNEGASFDRTYARAALVLWPSASRLAVLNQAGLAATLPYLEHLAKQWHTDGARARSQLKTEALELSRLVLGSWRALPSRQSRDVDASWHAALDGYGDLSTDDEPDEDEDDSPDLDAIGDAPPGELGVARFLTVLTEFADLDLIVATMDVLTSQTSHAKADHASIIGALSLLPAERAAKVLHAIVVAHAVDAPGACAALLAAAYARLFARKPRLLTEAAAALANALPGDPATAPRDQWGRQRIAKPDAALVVDLVAVADRLVTEFAEHVGAHVLAWPRHFDPDAVLVPAMKRISVETRKRGPAATRLHAAAVEHLRTRTSLPLEPPRDWTRPSEVGCTCAHCRDLAQFLADPVRPDWALRAAQQHRTHVEAEIKRARADVDMRTERKGSPHSLICRKNQASYERRVGQRKQDLANLAVLAPRRANG
jgi:predicted 2-oxoglutarate/Fe(II)-dependent dioxygenase YbiX